MGNQVTFIAPTRKSLTETMVKSNTINLKTLHSGTGEAEARPINVVCGIDLL